MSETAKQGVLGSSDPGMNTVPLEFEAHVTEYQALREEIAHRLSNQQQIINSTIALIAVVFAIGQLLSVLKVSVPVAAVLPSIYPFLSIVLSAFGLMYAEQDFVMADIGTYINHHLRPRVDELLKPKPGASTIWEWENFRGKNHHYHTKLNAISYFTMSAAHYVVLILPSLALLVLYWLDIGTRPMTTLELTLFVLAVAFAVAVVFQPFVVWAKYSKIPPRHRKL